ncbi:ABC transporter [Paenibacillus selenitireducens]|uniref:ABC transporter n=1 Tax=Paenibacillus selenitireducens TaxID=1324314 RepID=A0A1T2X2L0_9BACL|nr:ABC transporter permease [Paenibacillus selenitireducens]OPA74089.1 ABC transporter [Paenibacillus selenitireducens]
MLQMFIAQTKAESLRIIRSPFFLLFSIAMPLGFYFLFTSLNGADKSIQSTTWGVFSLMSMTAFSLIGTAVSQFGIRLSFEHQDGWVRLLRLTPLTPAVWLGSKLVAQMVIQLIVISVIFLSAGLVHDIQLSGGQWISCGLWLWMGSLPFLALGALLGTLKNANTAIAIGNILQMGLAIMGGLWMPLSTLPQWMQSIGEWLPSHRYANGAWNMVAGNTPASMDFMILIGCGLGCMVLSVYIFNRREAV